MKSILWQNLSDAERRAALLRPALTDSTETTSSAAAIADDVRVRGDVAVRALTLQFDGVDIERTRLSPDEIKSACESVPEMVREAVRDAVARVKAFHEACRPQAVRTETAPGVVCERRPVPIQSVGLYVPAGRSPLPSTAIMLGIPSLIAGCPTRVLCVPPRPDGSVDPVVVFAARECGIASIFRIGGAQAIAAMAFGTDTVPKCDKVFGPGNAFVTAAKQYVSQSPSGAAIDMPAGPSEVMVIADEKADPNFVAADILSQCEHGPDSQAILVTTSRELAATVSAEIENQLSDLPTAAVARVALAYSSAIVVQDLNTAVRVANEYAPEHLIVQTEAPGQLVDQITTAGSVFLGRWTPETLGDYCSGTNHVLPTYGWARSYGGLSVDSFVRYMTVQSATRIGLMGLAKTATTLATAERLVAHARAVTQRVAAIETTTALA